MIPAPAVPAPAAAVPSRPASYFECDMRRGDAVRQPREDDSARFLPPRWKVRVDRPGAEDGPGTYDDPVLGRPLRLMARWGYKKRFFDGRGNLIHSDFDYWTVDYSLMFEPSGRLLMWNHYFRARRPHSVMVGGGQGYCRELGTRSVRKPS